MRDRIRVGQRVLKIGDLIEYQGIKQVIYIPDKSEYVPHALTMIQTNTGGVLLRQIYAIYKRNKQQGFDRFEIRGRK